MAASIFLTERKRKGGSTRNDARNHGRSSPTAPVPEPMVESDPPARGHKARVKVPGHPSFPPGKRDTIPDSHPAPIHRWVNRGTGIKETAQLSLLRAGLEP